VLSVSDRENLRTKSTKMSHSVGVKGNTSEYKNFIQLKLFFGKSGDFQATVAM